MPAFESDRDASFFTSLHQAVPRVGLPADVPRNRRARPRRPFHSVQRIAPRNGDEIPCDDSFFEVPCYDLTRQGFSFLLAAPPAFESLVVEFAVPPGRIYVAADVVRYTRVVVFPPDARDPLGSWARPSADEGGGAEGGLARVLVGCRFAGRLRPP